MKKNGYIFIIINSILLALLWKISSSGLIETNSNILQLICIVSLFMAIILEFGGEFIVTIIYTYKNNIEFNYKLFIFSIIINYFIIKLLFYRIYNYFILLFCINQILGFLLGSILRKRKDEIF